MQYQVPQFIEIEDKIFGPLTIKQFLYLAGAGGLSLVFFSLLPFFIFIFLAIPVMAFGFALAFFRVNDRPFIVAVEHGLKYFLGHKLYLWKPRRPDEKSVVGAPTKASGQPPTETLPVPKLSESRLKDLAWSLNIKDRNQMGVTSEQRTGFEI
jgi:hypothetical protein